MATSSSNGSNYYVLLMITDGVISDMDATKEAIVIAARLPISIIIVGVGPAEFDGEFCVITKKFGVGLNGCPGYLWPKKSVVGN